MSITQIENLEKINCTTIFLPLFLGKCVRGKIVVYRVADKYHLVLSGLFSNFKAPNVINKLLLSLVYYVGSFKI